MAKKSQKSDRQQVIDEIRRKQKGSEKRRGFAIVGVCALVALLIVAAAAYRPVKNWYELRKFQGIDLASIGGPASTCQDVTFKPAEGNNDHVDTSQQVTYDSAPPAFGAHWNELNVAPAPFNRKYYEADDRPELESLVHNSEHGYTILWYDTSIADDADKLNMVNAIADKFRSDSDNYRFKFIAAPWTGDDEKESGKFPDGQHVAMTHWTTKGGPDEDQQQGVFQYCSEPSGAALEQFMIDYPYTDAPEPNVI